MSSLDAAGNPPGLAPLSAAPSAQPYAPESRPPLPAPGASVLREAFGRLSAVLIDVAQTADVVVGERCPHRGVRSRCRYSAPCRNQVAVGVGWVCGGDAHVRFEPVADVVPPSRGSEAG